MVEMTNAEIVELVESGKTVKIKVATQEEANRKKYAISQAKAVKFKEIPKELRPDIRIRYKYEEGYLYAWMESLTSEVEEVG